MVNIIIFGPPGSGKGTQSEKIIGHYGLMHISTGDILRNEINEGTDLGLTARKFIDRGELVPDNIIVGMLENRLTKCSNSKGVIFDGFPRTLEQAKALKEMLGKKGRNIDLLLNLEVENQELINRLLKRGETSGRTDDNLDTIEKRILVYENQTKPVIDFYKSEGCYKGIRGNGSIDDIFNKISLAIDEITLK